MEKNDDISELKDSFGEVRVNIAPEMYRQAMIDQRATPFGALCPVARPILRESV